MMYGKSVRILAILFALPASAPAQNVPRTTSNSDYGFSGNRRWAGVSRNSSATTSYNPQSKKSEIGIEHHLSGVVFGKEFTLGNLKASGNSWPQSMHASTWLQFGAIVTQRSEADGGLNLSWSREAPIFERWYNLYVWGVPLTVGARCGLAFGAGLTIAPDFTRPASQTVGNFPTPVRISGNVSARAFVTLSAGLGCTLWGLQVFLGIEATLNVLNGSIGMDVTSGADRDRGSVWLDFQAVSGEIVAVARFRIKIWRWKVNRSKSVSLFRFGTAAVRKYLLQFGT